MKNLLHSFTPFKKTVTDLKPYFYGLYSVVLILLLAVTVLFFHIPKTYAATYTWDGGGGDNNWSTCANWSSDTCPTSADTATFNSTSTKDATIDASFGGTITTLNINSGYTGTITMARLFTLTTFTQGAGSFIAANQTLTINGGFTLSTGNFTASSGTTSVGQGFTISGGIFNHNNGTVNFNTSSAGTLSCNNVTFNLVTFTHTASTKTVNSNCTLPLGNNPSLGASVSLSGTLSGSGTITTSVGNFTLNSGAILSGFSGLVLNAFIISGATVDLSSFSPVDVNNAFTLSSGTFIAPSGTMTIAQSFTVSGGTFNHNNGTLTFDGTAAGTLSCNNTSFNFVTFANTANTKTVNSDCTLPIGANPSFGSGVTLNGTLTGSGTLSGTGTLVLNSGYTLSGFTGISSGSLSISGATANLGSYNPLTLTSFTLSSGTFTAPSGTMSITTNLTISGGTFNHNNGTLNFNGGTSGTLSCNNASFNIVTFTHAAGTKTVNSNCNLPLGSNPTNGTGSGGTITLNGTLSGSGTLTMNSTSTLTTNSGATLSGFNGFVGRITVAGAAIDFGNYNPVTISTFTLSSGTFTAPSGDMRVSGAFTITGGLFNHNNGTITFDGGSTTISCNNVTFNAITFAHTSTNTKTISSNCNLPLGTNPSIQGRMTVNGTLSGSGTLSLNATTAILTLNSTAVLSGFTGLSVGNSINIAGGTWDFSAYSTFITNENLSLSSGAVFTAAPNMNIAQSLSISADTTFNHNNGTITFGNETGSLTCNNASFHLIVFNHSNVTKTINSGCTIPLGNNPTVGSSTSALISLQGTFTGTGILTIQDLTLTTATAGLSGFSGLNIPGRLVVSNNAVIDMSSFTELDVGSFYLIGTAPEFTAPVGTMIVHDVWQQSAGTFNHNNGTVKFVGDAPSIYSGIGTTFFNFIRDLSDTSTTGDSMSFTTEGTQTIMGSLTLKGLSNKRLILNSLVPGTQWDIDPQGTRNIEYVEVRDSNNSNATVITAGQESYDLGNNTNWNNLIATGTSDALSTSSGINEQASNSDWWNYNWVWRKQLTFNNTSSNLGTSSEELRDFPVLVKLSSSNFDFNKAKSDGSDIRFIDADNKTTLSYEIEKWDKTNQQAFIWVKVPQIDVNSNSDFIYLYSGNPNASDAQSVRNVWNTSFASVWHLKEEGSTTYDSTANLNNGAKLSVSQPRHITSGKMGAAQQFDGTNDYITYNNNLITAAEFTISGWANMMGTGGGVDVSNPIFEQRDNSTGNTSAIVLFADKYTSDTTFDIRGASNSTQSLTNTKKSLNEWHYYTAVATPTTLYLYVDGILVDSQNNLQTGSLATSIDHRSIGRHTYSGGGKAFFNGLIDEVRVSSSSRSAAWIAAEYKSGIDEYINYESISVVPSGQNLNIASNVSSGDNGKLRIRGTMRTGSDILTMNKVECSANGGSYQGAIAVDGEFNEQEEEYYFDYLSSDNGWKGDGYSVRCRATRAGGVVIDNVLYFTPFTLDNPSHDAVMKDSKPTFTFSVIKHHDLLKETISKYQIQIRRPNVGSWTTYIDNIPANKEDGTYETDTLRVTYSNKSSSIKVQSKSHDLSGPYIWKAVAVDKSDHTLDTETRTTFVKTNKEITPGFPLAILSIGQKQTNISSIHPQNILDSYTTNSLSPQFFGISNTGSRVTVRLTDVTCATKKEKADCTKIYITNANSNSRFGINIPKKDLQFGKIYTTVITAEYGNSYTELPPFKLNIINYQMINPTPSNSQVPVKNVENIYHVPAPTITQVPIKTSKKICFFSFCL